MVSIPQPCVVDANVLIDLYLSELLRELFNLSLDLVAPDVVITELLQPDAEEVLAYGLRQAELSGQQVEEVASLRSQYRRLSASDLSAFVLARSLNGTLLTNEGSLRRLAQQEELPVHGTLWLLDRMVEADVILPGRAAEALERMLSCGSRFPRAECKKRFQRWK